jgi:chromate reductase
MLGGFGANHHLRQVLSNLNMPILQQPEAYFSKIAELLDGKGGFQSESTQKFAQPIVNAFVEHINRY